MNIPPEVKTTIEREGVKAFVELVSKLLKWGGRKLNRAVQIEDATQKYLNRYSKRHGIIRIFGMSNPISLREIYTSVKFLNAEYRRSFSNAEEIEIAFRNRDRERMYTSYADRRDGVTVANECQFLNVLGGPGSGKSTYLRRLGLQALSDRGFGGEYLFYKTEIPLQNPRIPVFIELRSFDPNSTLENAINAEFSTCGFPNDFGKCMLDQGKLLVLLDGLDEVPKEYFEKIVTHIRDFIDRYETNRFVTSCRIAVYRNWFPRFTDVALADFDDGQIQTFIQQWFRSSSLDHSKLLAQRLWETLKMPMREGTLELARCPLLLAFLCLVYQRGGNLPNGRASLYKKAISILTEEWPLSKGIERSPVAERLHSDVEQLLLYTIAGRAFEEDKRFFSREALLVQIHNFFSERPNAPQGLQSTAVLEEIENQQGLLVRRTEEFYSFAHLTLQEYFAACYFFETGRLSHVVDNHLFDRGWHEVFLLLAGTSRADELLARMALRINTSLRECGRLQRLIVWVGKSAIQGNDRDLVLSNRCKTLCTFLFASFGGERPLVRANSLGLSLADEQAATLAIAIGLSLQLASKFDPTFFNNKKSPEKLNLFSKGAYDQASNLQHAMELIDEFESTKAFKVYLTQKVRSNLDALASIPIPFIDEGNAEAVFLSRIATAFFTGLDCQESLVQWPEADSKALESYLYANVLLLDCEKASVHRTEEVWRTTVSKLFTVSE